MTLGNSIAQDAGIIFDGAAIDVWLGVDNSDNIFKIGTSTTMGSSTVLSLLSSGDIGIGSTSPMYTLSVNGGLAVTGSTYLGNIAYTWPTSQGVNYALTTDGAGTLSWTDLGAGGTVASGTPGWIPYYAGYGNTLTPTSSIYISPSGNVGIGLENNGSYMLYVNGASLINGTLVVLNGDGSTAGGISTVDNFGRLALQNISIGSTAVSLGGGEFGCKLYQ